MLNRSTFSPFALALAWAFGALAIAQAPEEATPEAVSRAWMAIDRDGASRVIDGLPGEGVAWVAVVSVAATRPLEAPGPMIELADGQRLPGELAEVRGGAVRWRSPRLGEFSLAIDDVAAIRPGGEPPAEVGVRFANGDEALGRVSLTGEGVIVESAIGRIRAGWDRVAGVRLGEGRMAPEGMAVWLRHGGVLAAESVRENAGGRGVVVEMAGGRLGQFHRGEIAAITRAGAVVRPAGTPSTSDGMEPLEGGGLLARAPARATWRLEPGTVGVFGAATAPERSRKWSDALVSAWAGSRALFSVRAEGDRGRAALAASVAATEVEETLTVSVQPGAAGAAGGVVELWLAVVVAP